MSAPSWFIAGLLAGAAAMLGGMLLWRLSRETTLRSRKVLLAGGLTAVAIAAMASGLSLAISSGPGPAVASDDLAAAGSQPAPTPAPSATSAPAAMASTSSMPPASVMAQILSTPGSARPGMAQPMDQAAADLAARLERKGGTAADWNLLAQAYDFLGRPADAQRARARAAKAGAAPAAR
ncbi:MAG TPA: hypothetical protein VJ738_13650 [Steroidobacteraceae bacterium]|nr:hypothetical protein [Steroidobacteraceae bacterium]